jgi:PAS domain S-box-containing protein
MNATDRVNVLLVDDQPGKLLSYEVMLSGLGENLIKAASAKEALEHLLKTDVAVILVDVCMPELDGFELAKMIREHPRFQRVAIIFISAIHLTETDYLRGYDAGAVDYVPVPVVPELLRAKVKVFAELYRKTRQLEQLNRELESRVSERTAALEASTARLLQSEQGRSLALAAGNMGSWDYDFLAESWTWDEGQRRIFGVDDSFVPTLDAIRRAIHPDDLARLRAVFADASESNSSYQTELRVIRPDGDVRWCTGAAAATIDNSGHIVRLSGVIADITDRKDAEVRQTLLAREVDHRARNALAVVQAIVRLARADTTESYVKAIEGRIRALAQTHELLSQSRWQGADVSRLVTDELAPYRGRGGARITADGPPVILPPDKAQTLALALHELATNAAKYGALSSEQGELAIKWTFEEDYLTLDWRERGGPSTEPPSTSGFGTKIINASLNSRNEGQAKFNWRPEGLHCTLAMSCSTAALRQHTQVEYASNTQRHTQSSFGKHILLVEDEALIGMLIYDLLVDWGFQPTSPYSRLDDAMAAAKAERFDGAILDMNLNGEPVYPLARLLESQSVPFVFLTGYARDGIDKGFASCPVLQKPIAPEMLEAVLRGQGHRPKAVA